MTIDEVIERIKSIHFRCEDYDGCPYGHDCTVGCLESVQIAIQALEKQIPKKPFQPFGTHSYKCSNCWKFVAHEVDDDCDLTDLAEWCPYCGQKLDWNLDS